MSDFERAAMYADLADAAAIAYFAAEDRGDLEGMELFREAANSYYQNEHDALRSGAQP